jgi:hypothetical protein
MLLIRLRDHDIKSVENAAASGSVVGAIAQLSQAGKVFTVRVNGVILYIAGIFEKEEGVAHVWLHMAIGYDKRARALLESLGELLDEHGKQYKQVWTHTQADFDKASTFIERLGFSFMEKVTLNGILFNSYVREN